MNPLDSLITYFATGTAEGDGHILDRVFVRPEQFEEVISFPPGSPRLLVGNKGVGKTALLEWLAKVADRQGIPTLLLRPDDLEAPSLEGKTAVGDLKRAMYQSLVTSIAAQIGSKLEGLISGEAVPLYDAAIREGTRSVDRGTKLLTLLSAIAKPVLKVDGAKLAKDLEPQGNGETLVRAVETYLLAEKKIFLLLVDDTDQVASPDDPTHLNRLWGLILAIRKLCQGNRHVRPILTLRSEVWQRLMHGTQGQRDQRDHIRPLVVNLRAPEYYLQDILQKRLRLAQQDAGLNGSDVIQSFFESDAMLLPSSEDERSWSAFILKSSRERPRDLIQLVNLLGREAKRMNRTKIVGSDAEQVMGTYSKDRAEDIAEEFAHDCPDLRDVIRAFSDVEFDTDFETLRKFLHRLPTRFSLSVRRTTLRPDDDNHAILLLSVLHEAGFINPRVQDASQPRGFRHITFLDDSEFVKKSRWNDMQAVTWEVHPAFRTYLLGLSRERGLRRPPRRR